MILLPKNQARSKAYTFVAEVCDTGNDSLELQLMKARGVRGVSQVDLKSGVCVIHIQALGRGPLQCEQALVDALSRVEV